MQNFDHNIGFWEKRHFFRRKLAKIVIITSTPGSATRWRSWGPSATGWRRPSTTTITTSRVRRRRRRLRHCRRLRRRRRRSLYESGFTTRGIDLTILRFGRKVRKKMRNNNVDWKCLAMKEVWLHCICHRLACAQTHQKKKISSTFFLQQSFTCWLLLLCFKSFCQNL
jgi:hypothetical protein